MNAPLNDALRQALERVTLNDKPQSGLHHTYTVDSAAEHRGFGVQRCVHGGVL